MWVSVLRHGEAGEAADDRSRALTSQGVSDVGQVARALMRVCGTGASMPPPDQILHSPYLRTTQTAQHAQSVFPAIPMQVQDALVPEGAVADVEALLLACQERGCEHVVLVSHQPLVSYLLDHFLGGEHAVPPMLPSAMTTLSMDVVANGCGQLACWFAPPLFEPQGR